MAVNIEEKSGETGMKVLRFARFAFSCIIMYSCLSLVGKHPPDGFGCAESGGGEVCFITCCCFYCMLKLAY